MHKEGKPVPKDVIKAAANVEGYAATYDQSFRAIRSIISRKLQQDELGFQLIIPYLQKFMQLNPGSTVRYEMDGNNISHIFVCPGIMKTTMKNVRPVMSLDAAHLKSKWKGILYTASVMTASNNVYPVAIAITHGNENESGWNWFLGLLDNAIDVLKMDHPRSEVRYKYFTFISDRQKGLIGALNSVFPQNHSCFCSIHIARNAEKICGKKVAKRVHKLSTTFSHLVSSGLMEEINKMSTQGARYLQEIPPQQWRSTSWLDDRRLPPRYGIVTSNMSESTNNMFDKAREMSWFNSLDYMLGRTMERISTLREEVKNKDGIVEHVVALLRRRWDMVAGYKVVQIREDGDEFTIIRPNQTDWETTTEHNIDVVNCRCSCGEWQEHSIPCVHAIVYFRLHEEKNDG